MRSPDTFTLDPVKILVAIFVVLIMAGVIPFTAVSVGAAILGTMCGLQMTWSR